MTIKNSLPAYERLSQALRRYDPAEIHGMLCGMLCTRHDLAGDTWLRHLADENIVSDFNHVESLRELYVATVRQFRDDDFGFFLLLPDDDSDLSARATSLGFWCQGFLSGLGLGGMGEDTPLPAEAHEFLKDVSQIAWVGFDANDADDEDETAYTEIVEYMRTGVLLISQELRSPPNRTATQRLH